MSRACHRVMDMRMPRVGEMAGHLSHCHTTSSGIRIITRCRREPSSYLLTSVHKSAGRRKRPERKVRFRTMATRRRLGQSSASRDGHPATKYSKRNQNWRRRDSFCGRGKVAGTYAICLRSLSTRSTNATENSTFQGPLQPQEHGNKIGIGNPNSGLLLPAWRVTSAQSSQNRTYGNPHLVLVAAFFTDLVTRI